MMRKILIFILCFCTIFLCFVIPSFADEPATADTYQLSGTWVGNSVITASTTVSADVNFTSNNQSFYHFEVSPRTEEAIQYWGPSINVYNFGSPVGWVNEAYRTVDFGSTPQTVSASFYEWFISNFTSSVPEFSTIPSGVYHFKEFDFLDIPDASWSDGTGYTYSYTLAGKYTTTSRTIPFTALNVKFDEYVSDSHYTVTFSVDTSDGIVNLATYSASYGQVELEQRSDLKYLVFDEELVGSYDDIEFIRQFLASGFPDTDTSATDNPWAYILEMIIEALKVDLFGYFSVWDIFTTICGIFIVTWLLKLLAGG